MKFELNFQDFQKYESALSKSQKFRIMSEFFRIKDFAHYDYLRDLESLNLILK